MRPTMQSVLIFDIIFIVCVVSGMKGGLLPPRYARGMGRTKTVLLAMT